MTNGKEFAERFRNIDEAISRDVDRRRRNGLVSWALLLAASGVAVYAVLAGGTESEVVARQLSGDSGFTASVAASAEIRRTVAEEAQRVTRTESFRQELLTSPEVAGRIDAAVEDRVGEVRQDVEENRAIIQSFELRLGELPSAGNMRIDPSNASRFEAQQLTEFRATPAASDAELRREIENLTRRVDELQRELDRLR